MTPERRKSLAKGLAQNELLGELINEFVTDLRDEWENTQPSETDKRETIYNQLRATDELRDFLDARIDEYAGDGESGNTGTDD